MVIVGSIVVVGLALLALVLVARPLVAGVGRFAAVRAQATADIGSRTRMIVARLAALRVRWEQRSA